jgi:hypothetical protein
MGMLRIISWLLIVQRRDGCKMTIIDVLGFVFAAACFLILSKFRPAALERRGMLAAQRARRMLGTEEFPSRHGAANLRDRPAARLPPTDRTKPPARS